MYWFVPLEIKMRKEKGEILRIKTRDGFDVKIGLKINTL